MKEHLNQYKYIYLISVIGFILTGVLAHPYHIHFDSNYVFTKYSLEHLPPTNWMGWFYPYFWDLLYKITNNKLSIAIFHNLVYWISMPTIYINFFQKKENIIKFNTKYHYWYMALVSFPFALGLLMGVTNNILLVSFLLLSVANFSVFLNNKNKIFFVISLLSLLLAAFLRREALIIVIPIMIYFNLVFSNRKWLQTFLMSVLFLGMYSLINYSVVKKIPNYNDSTISTSINTIELVTLYDLTVMSYYKNELLLPDFILKEEYRGENRNTILQLIRSISIYDLAFGWSALQNQIGPLLVSETVWHSGLSLKEAFPIYLQNVFWYLWLKLNMLYAYGAYLWGSLIFSLFTIVLLLKKRFQSAFPKDQKEFCIVAFITSWIFSVAIILSAMSTQPRYLIPSNLLLWITSIYILYTITTTYKIKINYEERAIED